DLYPVVRNAVLIGFGSYHFDRLRTLFPGDRPDGVTLLDLSDWLRRLPEFARRPESAGAAQHSPAGHRPAPGADDTRTATDEHQHRVVAAARPDTHRTEGEFGTQSPPPPSSVEAALSEYAAEQQDPAHPAAIMAAILGYRRRERRASSWAHTDRLTHPVREWADAPGVLVGDWGTVDTKWHRSPDGATMRRFLTLTGRLGSGGGLRPGPTGTAAPAALPPGTRVHTFYDRVGPSGRRTTGTAVVLGCAVDADFDDAVRLEEILPEDRASYDELPIAIAPGVPEWDFRAEA